MVRQTDAKQNVVGREDTKIDKTTSFTKDFNGCSVVAVENDNFYGNATINALENLSYSDEEAQRVKWKTDLILLPLLCICYVFSV